MRRRISLVESETLAKRGDVSNTSRLRVPGHEIADVLV